MSMLRRSDLEFSDERGSVIVAVVAIWLILMGVVAGLVIEIGHTAAHRRHLQVQTDAAALAAAQDFSLCTTAPSTAASHTAQTALTVSTKWRSTEARTRSRMASRAGGSPTAGARCATRRG